MYHLANLIRENEAMHATPRRGVTTLLVLGLTVLGTGLAALATHWGYLLVLQYDLQQRSDVLALAGAPLLLDEDLLAGRGSDPADDVQACTESVDRFRRWNNARSSRHFTIDSQDVELIPGSFSPGGNFDEFTSQAPYNALQLRIRRNGLGTNAIPRLTSGWAQPPAAGLAARSLAFLDNRVIGFRPNHRLPAPVLPFALDARSWSTLPAVSSTGGSGDPEIEDLIVRVAAPAESPQPEDLAVVSFAGSLREDLVLQQLAHGVGIEDLPGPDQVLGPIVPGQSSWPVALRWKVDPGFRDRLTNRLQNLAQGGQDPRRVLPLLAPSDQQGNAGSIVDFVAVRILDVQRGGQSISLRLEPCFLTHPTVWTDPAVDTLNPMIHKLTLVR